MQSVAEVIAAYILARERHDYTNAMQTLAYLESDAFNNEADWAQILEFCRQHKFDARLEIITRRLIKSGNFSTYSPTFVLVELLLKSGFKAEARALMDEYKTRSHEMPAPPWDFINHLFSVDDFSMCLQEARNIIKEDETAFPFLIMEAKALLKLNELKTARQKLKALASLAEKDSGQLVWFSYVAMELGERDLLKTSLAKLLQMIEAGAAKLTEGAVHVLQRCGCLLEIQSLVRAAQPIHYENPDEFEYVFELAKQQGAQATALRFGEAILRAEPGHRLRPEIEKLSAAKGFLMT